MVHVEPPGSSDVSPLRSFSARGPLAFTQQALCHPPQRSNAPAQLRLGTRRPGIPYNHRKKYRNLSDGRGTPRARPGHATCYAFRTTYPHSPGEHHAPFPEIFMNTRYLTVTLLAVAAPGSGHMEVQAKWLAQSVKKAP
ncbi:hypothetical protein G6F24_016375 [Rhizopus arrhizus]|nr:hypothetical protein G6F24_016375 [Rhizopus arrhizus]